jgi:peptidoglycan/xylan/chitin deacetylase (PgdA/CDA1 family)
MFRGVVAGSLALAAADRRPANWQAHTEETPPEFWKNGKGLAITFSYNLEEGGQSAPLAEPASAAFEGLRNQYGWGAKKALNQPENKENGCVGERCYQQDQLSNSWYEYGIHEGGKRLLKLWDGYGIKTSSYIVGLAAKMNPAAMKALTASGHEAVCHGATWQLDTFMTEDEEREFHQAGIDAVKEMTNQTCKGFNAYWMLDSNNTLSILQSLGLTYHVDDLSRDIPFTKMVNGKPFAMVPYSLINNDIVLVAGSGFSSEDFYQHLVNEFDELYLESEDQHRMMSISSHARYGGRPGYVRAYRRFIEYAGSKSNVWFVRKDWMANWALKHGPRYGCEAFEKNLESVTMNGKVYQSTPICREDTCICGCGEDAPKESQVDCEELDRADTLL